MGSPEIRMAEYGLCFLVPQVTLPLGDCFFLIPIPLWKDPASFSIQKTSSQQGEKPEIATVQKPTFWRAKNAQIWYWTVKSNGGSIGMNLRANLGALATPKSMEKPSFCSPENQWRIWVIRWQNGEKSKCGCWNRGWVCLINPVKAEISGS